MSRPLAVATVVLVTLGVVTWLAGPTLEMLFGPEALSATDASLAAATGALTYVVVRRVAARRSSTASATPGTEAGDNRQLAHDAALVDAELERIRDEEVMH